MLLFALAACAAAPRHPELPFTRLAGPVVVHAETAELAEHVERAVQRALPAVEAIPGAIRRDARELRVWFVPGVFIDGRTMDTGIELEVGDAVPASGWQNLDLLVAHELAHDHLGPEWRELPAVVEEGFVDGIAQGIVSEAAPRRRATFAVLLGTVIGGALRVGGRTYTGRLDPNLVRSLPDVISTFELDRERYVSRPKHERLFLAAVGWLVASRVDVVTLRRLCAEARAESRTLVPAARILQAARLDPAAPSDWLAHLNALLGPAELRELDAGASR